MVTVYRLRLLETLKDNRKMADDGEFDRFVNALTELSEIQSPTDLMLPLLMEVFDRETTYLEEMDRVFKMVESYSSQPKYYVSTIVKQTPYVLRDAEKWLRILYLNFIYYDDERALLLDIVKSLPSVVKKIIIELIDGLPRQAFGEDMSHKFAEILEQ